METTQGSIRIVCIQICLVNLFSQTISLSVNRIFAGTSENRFRHSAGAEEKPDVYKGFAHLKSLLLKATPDTGRQSTAQTVMSLLESTAKHLFPQEDK